MHQYEDTIIMFRPLFGTSYLMQTYCEDHAFHGATRVVVTSASAKTAMGFGYLMKKALRGSNRDHWSYVDQESQLREQPRLF